VYFPTNFDSNFVALCVCTLVGTDSAFVGLIVSPQQFARSLPALLLTVGYLSFSLYSFFLAQPLMGAKKSLNLRFFVNIAMV
jgi:hypothetical protein